MIWESHFWKDDLLRRAASLSKRRRQSRLSQPSFAKIEQDVMFAAYAIRKLSEAEKLSDSTVNLFLSAKAFSARGRMATRINWHHIERLYDLSNGVSTNLPIRDFCNQVIHSYIFLPAVSSEGLESIFVTSDRDRNSRLIEVAIDDLVRLLNIVGSDYPTQFTYTANCTSNGATARRTI